MCIYIANVRSYTSIICSCWTLCESWLVIPRLGDVLADVRRQLGATATVITSGKVRNEKDSTMVITLHVITPSLRNNKVMLDEKRFAKWFTFNSYIGDTLDGAKKPHKGMFCSPRSNGKNIWIIWQSIKVKWHRTSTITIMDQPGP